MNFPRFTTSATKTLLGLCLGCGPLVGCSSSTPEASPETPKETPLEQSAPVKLPTVTRPTFQPSPALTATRTPQAIASAAAASALVAIEAAVDRRNGEPAQGNTEEARTFAKEFITEMTDFDQRVVGAAVDRTTHGDNYRAWCELQAGSGLFVVNVPGYGELSPDLVATVRAHAFERAQHIARNRLQVGDRLAVALRAEGRSIELMTGTYTEPAFAARDSLGLILTDRNLLYPFVRNPPPTSTTASTTMPSGAPIAPPTNPGAAEGMLVRLPNGQLTVVGTAAKPDKPRRDPRPGPIMTEADVRLALEDLQPDANRFDRNDAIDRLGKVAAPSGPRSEVTAALLKASQGEGHVARMDAIKALRIWGDASTVEILKANLASTTDRYERHDLIMTVFSLQRDDALDWLLELAGKNKSDEYAVEDAMAKLTPAVEPRLQSLLQSKDPLKQRLAIKALGKMGSTQSLPFLKFLTKNPDPMVKGSAGNAIFQIEYREEQKKKMRTMKK